MKIRGVQQRMKVESLAFRWQAYSLGFCRKPRPLGSVFRAQGKPAYPPWEV